MRNREGNQNKTYTQSAIKNKKIVLILLVLIFVVMAIFIATNSEIRKYATQASNGEMKNVEETNYETEIFEDGSAILTDDSAIVSSANITNRITGEGPFDANDEPGNDASAENNVVRSFDKVTWEIEANMAVNNTGHGSADANTYSKFRGGTIYIEATLPEKSKGLMKWSVEDMKWANGTGRASNDGLTFTAQYKMSEDVITVPGKQTLELILDVYGAENGTALNPTFKFWMQGNESNEENEGYEAIEIGDGGEKVKVSAKDGKYNIQLI